MNKTMRKALVAIAAVTAIGTVPVASQPTDQAWRGGYGDWPVSTSVSRF